MKTPHRLRLVARATLVALLVGCVPGSLSAADVANLSGRVVAADGSTPASGVVVHLARPGDAQPVTSEPTGADGAFRVSAAPGEYAVYAQEDDRLFVGPNDLALATGDNPALALTLRLDGPATGSTVSFAPGQNDQDRKKKGLPPWAAGIIAGSIGVAALVLIDEVTEDETETEASPF